MMHSGIILLAGLACIPHAVATLTGVAAQIPLQREIQAQATGEASMVLDFLDAVRAQRNSISVAGGMLSSGLGI